jgi:ABC-type multidrug transport system fused ATPase/permease subunit
MKTIARMGYSSASKWQLVPGIIGGIGKGVASPVDALILSSVAGYFFITDPDEMMRNVWIASGLYLGLAAGVFLATFLAIGTFAVVSESVTNRLRLTAISRVLSISSMGFFDDPTHSPALLTALISQSSAKAASLVTTLTRVGTEVLAALAIGAIVSFTASAKLDFKVPRCPGSGRSVRGHIYGRRQYGGRGERIDQNSLGNAV